MKDKPNKIGVEGKLEDPCLYKVLEQKYSKGTHSISHPDCITCDGSPDRCKNYVSYYSITGRKYDDTF